MIKKLFFFLFVLCSSITLSAQGYICAVGGGSEDYGEWSDAPYSWIVEKSDSGKLFIIYYDNTYDPTWYQNYFKSFGSESVEFLPITNADQANTIETYAQIITAKAIFFPGGDQWQYVKNLKNTKAATAVKEVYESGGVIAGTSAGCAILSGFVFTAENGSAYSDVALRMPFYSRMTLDNDILNIYPSTIFDTHYTERARFGRLLMFNYNIFFNYTTYNEWLNYAIGIDDKTALCIEPNGNATVHGTGTVEIFYHDQPVDSYDPFEFEWGYPNYYTMPGMKTAKLTNGWGFNLISQELSNIPDSAIPFNVSYQSVLENLPKTNFIITANDNFNSYKSSLDTAFTLTNCSSTVIITHNGVNNSDLTNYLSSININYSEIILTTEALNNSEYSAILNNSDFIIFSGNDLELFSSLKDNSTQLGNVFNNKINEKTFIFFIGNSGKIAGKNYVDNTDNNSLAAYRGLLQLKDGLGIYNNMIFQPGLFDDDDLSENRTTAVTWGLMRSRGVLGIYSYSDQNLYFDINKMTVEILGKSNNPLIIIDNSTSTYLDSSNVVASGSYPRNSAALVGATYIMSNDIKYFKLDRHRFSTLTSVEDKSDQKIPNQFYLENNYPNPFNPATTIEFSVPASSENNLVSLKIYDVLGNEVATLVNEQKSPGNYKVNFNAKNLSSGIYFYILRFNNSSITKKMVLLK